MEVRSKASFSNAWGSKFVVIGASLLTDGNNLSGGHSMVYRDERELSPSSKQEDQIKAEYNPNGGLD